MKLYVGNLSHDTNDAQLTELFTPYGKPLSVHVVIDKDGGSSRGFAFVEFNTADEANAAIAGLNGKDFMGRALKVNESKPKTAGARA